MRRKTPLDRTVPWIGRLVVAAVAIGGGASLSEAHPHVWVDYDLTVMFEKGLVVGLREDWSFDEDFSAAVMHDIVGEKKIKTIGPAENAKIEKTAFSNLKNYGYFTHVFAADAKVDTGEATGFKARLEGAKLAYTFTVPLAHGVDAKTGPASIGIWDDTYYVDVGPAKGMSPKLDGAAPACKAVIVEDHQHPIYFGSVFPMTVRITC